MPPVPERRLVPSPYSGTVLATDVCYSIRSRRGEEITPAGAPICTTPSARHGTSGSRNSHGHGAEVVR